jgi:UDP-N-acetylglucosamine 1-carboxyvinyltransferase
VALIRGVESLHGSELQATDLRGGAALIVAALSAEGESLIYDDGHIRRGYEDLHKLLGGIGASIELSVNEAVPVMLR